MKTILSLITVFSMVVQAQTANTIPETKTFKIEQETSVFQLQHQEKEPIFETREEPSTCYRTVQRGTKQECHTEYEQECNTTYENECRNVPYPVCENVQRPVCQQVPRRSCHSEPRQKCETHNEQQCHNENRQSCSTVNEQQCHSEPQRVCTNVPRRECHAENRQHCTTTNEQQCSTQSVPVCVNEPRQVCETVQKCETVSDQVCRGEGAAKVCQTVPRRVCTPQQQCKTVNSQVCHNETKNVCHNVPKQSCTTVSEQVCNTVNDQVCHTENKNVCQNVPRQVCTTQSVPVCQNVPRQSCHTENEQVCNTEYDQVCHTETQQQCHNEYRQECRQVPRQSCENVPHQACETVPNMEQEAYACTKPVQVQVGERVKLSLLANVKVQIANFAGKLPTNQDEIIASLIKTQDGDDVGLKLGKNDKKTIYRIVKKERVVQTVSATEKIVNVNFTLELISADVLATMKDLKIVESKILTDKISFKLQSAAGSLPANQTVLFDKGTLNVVQEYRRKTYTVIDQVFDPSLKIKKVLDTYEIAVAGFGVQYLENAKHMIKLELKLKSLFDKKELLNPEILDQVTLGTIHSEFEGFPVQ